MGFDPQLGLGEETTPGSAVTVTRFYDFGQESLKQDIERIEYAGLRPSRLSLGSSNWVAGRQGVSGDIELAVMTKSAGLLFKHCLGSVATSTPTGGTSTRDHLCTEGTLDGKGLTVQVGRPMVGSTAQPFTYAGCKVAKWALKHDTQSQLMLTLSLDGVSETTATGLASASYPTAIVPYAYTTGVITVAGSSFDVMDWSLEVDNALKTDRYYIRSTTPGQKKEQLGVGLREYTGSLTADFTNTTAYNRFVNGTTATFTAVYTATTAIEGALFPQLTISADVMRFDGETPNVEGYEMVDQALPFKLLNSGSAGSPLSVTVRSSDTTP
jgi:hypothetical protein